MPRDKWVPIGPTAVRRGQALQHPTISGRVNALGFGQDGSHVYAATCNGGVWYTQDGGLTWKSLMEGFDLNPTTQDSDSLACGAMAVIAGGGTAGADRIYVGSGEPYGQGNINSPVSSYYGVGMLMSDDGGQRWNSEPSTPSIVGGGVWRLAVDPSDKDRVVAAATGGAAATYMNSINPGGVLPGGLYMRVPATGGGFSWEQQQWPFPGGGGTTAAIGNCTGVAVSSKNGVTVFYAAIPSNSCCKWDSTGKTWQSMETGLPIMDCNTIALAMQPGNTDVVYALLADTQNFMKGVWRLDTSVDNKWRQITGHPTTLFGDRTAASPFAQGDYDVAIAVAPDDINLIYLGGSGLHVPGGEWVAGLYRCKVDAGKHTMATTHIGKNVHADIHALEFPPGDKDHVWVGCDGGVFVTDQASTTTTGDRFVSRNTGLSTVQAVRLALHPKEAGVLFAGTQDNGTLRYTGEEAWLRVGDGDGGAVVVNPRDTSHILRSYQTKSLEWTTEGAQSPDPFFSHHITVPLDSKETIRFYPPMASPPFDPATSDAKDADIVALGSRRVWLSRDFGKTWHSIPKNTLKDDALDLREIEALTFASPSKLYAGTSLGNVFCFTYNGTTWQKTQLPAIPNISGASNPGTNAITSIAIDLADASGDSVYVSIGGIRDPKAMWLGHERVWHYTAAPAAGQPNWEARGGPTPHDPDWSLLDTHHTVVVVDPDHKKTLYAGAYIGVWRSIDGGAHWFPYSFGLPDAAVSDIKLHQKGRVLFAATDGRGVYAMPADSPAGGPQASVMLLVRDTQLDTRYTQQYDITQQQSFEGGFDPTSATACTVTFGTSPDIRVDTPDKHGDYLAPTTDLGPVQFAGGLPADNIATAYAPKGSTVVNRVYVQVHNRGSLPIGDVQVMLVLAPCSGTAPAAPTGKPTVCVAPGPSIPALPAGYADNVRAGTPINTAPWVTLGVKKVQDVRALMPRIAQFDLPSDKLTGASEYCLLALLHLDNTIIGFNAFPNSQGATTAWGAQATDVQYVCSHTPLAAYKRLRTTATTRATTHPDPSLFAQVLTTIGLGFLVASDDSTSDNSLVNA